MSSGQASSADDGSSPTRRPQSRPGRSPPASSTARRTPRRRRQPATPRSARPCSPRKRRRRRCASSGAASMRVPGSRPYPAVAAGTDMMPEIENVVVLMMENHSYDNFFGMLGRGRSRRRAATASRSRRRLPDRDQPYPNGALQRAFRMPTTCQLSGAPSQEWLAAICHDNGSTTTWRQQRLRRHRRAAGRDGLLDRRGPAVHLRAWRARSRSATAGSAACSARPTRTAAT